MGTGGEVGENLGKSQRAACSSSVTMSTTPPEPTSLPSPPTDGITGLSYLPSSSLLASSSWDGGLRIHDTSKQEHLTTHAMESGPLLSLSACPAAGGSTGGAVYAGAIDGSVRRYDVETSAASTVGMHSADVSEANRLLSGEVKVAASCVGAVDANLVASAGWDGKFHVWDARLSGGKRNAAAASIDLPGKAFSMDVTGDGTRAVVATSGRRNVFVDIRAGSVSDKENGGDAAEVILDRESSLKYQTRVVRFFPDARAIAVGSIEGRVAIEFLDDIGIKSGEFSSLCFLLGQTSRRVPADFTDLLPVETEIAIIVSKQARRSTPSSATGSMTPSTPSTPSPSTRSSGPLPPAGPTGPSSPGTARTRRSSVGSPSAPRA